MLPSRLMLCCCRKPYGLARRTLNPPDGSLRRFLRRTPPLAVGAGTTGAIFRACAAFGWRGGEAGVVLGCAATAAARQALTGAGGSVKPVRELSSYIHG